MSRFSSSRQLALSQKIRQINWVLILIVVAAATIGVAMLYSAADGSWDPWAARQITRFTVGLVILVTIALVDLRFWWRYAYLLFAILLALLLAVEVAGSTGMGAQRWIDLGVIKLQPSELMKIGLILALARYFHGVSMENVRRIPYLLIPLLLVALPSILVLKQPDLGTALFLVLIGVTVFFIAGVRIWKFVLALAATGVAIPIVWSMLRTYQQKRILTFFNPEIDPLGAGYHILQSKIALGSGGVFGKGFMQGSQSHLNFLPEKQTDFIFTMMAEEFGMMGGLTLLGLYSLILVYGFAISMRSQSHFGRLLALGLTAMMFLYVFINIAMVMGLIPVVGVPLPLISYGGTAMLTQMVGIGFLINVNVHRDLYMSRTGGSMAN
ncbi:MAG: rod shape-determining protein RodA [Pseudomonadota bacterium]|nr:rod shape-determining protein RodA [Pseudomonadota bacterium]